MAPSIGAFCNHMKKQPSNQQIMQALQRGFKETEKGFEESKKDTDFLKQGFEESKKDVNVLKQGFKELQQNHELILESIRDFAELVPTKAEMYAKFDEMGEEIDVKLHTLKVELTQEIESVKLRQDNSAYRFELNALDKRVAKLETKATC